MKWMNYQLLLENENKYKFAFREDFHQNKFLHLVKISNLKIIFTTYLKIFLLKELSIKNKMFYSKHLSKKIVFPSPEITKILSSTISK